MTRLVFFYGTLMSGHMRAGAAQRAGLRLVGPARIRGDLYSVHDSFPAFVTGAGEITGEVWEAPDDNVLRSALRVTDRIEGYDERSHSGMYLREEHPLLDDAEGRTVLVYRWNDAPSRLRPIPSGDWRAYCRALREPEPEEDELEGADVVLSDGRGGVIYADWKAGADR
jgi:gamma-glutamylcyclotransferase (GGCT)/AIG2-like uncharacterized protein YtfP